MEKNLENSSRKSFQPSINNEGTYKLYKSLLERNKKSIVARNFDKEMSIDEIEKLLNQIRNNCIELEQFHTKTYFGIKNIVVWFKLPIIIYLNLQFI